VAFAAMTLVPAAMVVTARNLFHAALYLLVSLFGTAGLFVILVAPFLAAIQVLVYMGAIGILIIFSVMLTRGMMKLDQVYNTQQIAGAVTAVLLFIALAVTLSPLVDELGIDGLEEVNADFTTIDEPADVDSETIQDIGLVIADRNGFALPFEVASMLLTAAMIGAIVVAREDEA
jgi:NADH-quinone oxidoreductase subunit J